MKKILKIWAIIMCLYITICILHNTSFLTIIDHWQQLVGSFLGAITPLALFFYSERHQNKKKQKEFFLLLQKNIISAINNLSDVDKMLHRFAEIQLKALKDRINEDTNLGRYSIGQAFVPLSATFVIDKDIITQTTSSSYLENLVLDIVATSHELPLLLQDIGRQFDKTITFNTQIALMKLGKPKDHNEALLENLKAFEIFLEQQTFSANIPIYLRKLVSTKVALQTMDELGLKKWKKLFNFKFSPEASQKMTDYFKLEVNKQITDLQKDFGSKLLLVGEEVRYT